MHYTKEDIEAMDRVSRLKIINSVSGVKPANLIGTVSEDGVTNVAIFSSVVHLGSNPALLGFISRPQTDEVGDTYRNILKNEQFTINHIHPEFVKNAHYTSGKFDALISEFDRCGLTEEFIENFEAPFVKERQFKMGLNLKEVINIKLNGTVLVIGEIVHLMMPDEAVKAEDVDLEKTNAVGISGLNSYYELKKIAQYPYVRLPKVPNFKK